MFLALREMRRAKLRFGLLIGAVGLLVFLILFQQSLLNSLITQFIGALRNQDAPVIVYSANARKNIEASILDPATAERVLAVDGAARGGLLGEDTFSVTANGTLQDAAIFGYQLDGPGAPATLTAGRLPERSGEAVASEANADDGFAVGDVVRVEPGGYEMTVVGVGRDLNYSVSPTLFTSYETYERAKQAKNPDAGGVVPTAVLLVPAEGVTAEQLRDRVNASVPGVEALTREQATTESPAVAATTNSFRIVFLLFYLVVPLVIGLFFVIVTFQKAQALTLLRAIGASPGLLVRALVVQLLAVLVGGLVVASVLQWLASLAVRGDVTISLEPRSVLATGLLLGVFALVASYGAIRRVLRIDPIRATTGVAVTA